MTFGLHLCNYDMGFGLQRMYIGSLNDYIVIPTWNVTLQIWHNADAKTSNLLKLSHVLEPHSGWG